MNPLSKNSGGQNASQQGGAGAGKEDYGDKAFQFASKKAGHPVDRNTTEKATDAARGAYEKLTGKKVNPKFSQ